MANEKVAQAKERLIRLGYKVAVQPVPAKDTKPGRVVAQTPDPVTESVSKGQTVTLEVSTGPPSPSPFRARISVASDDISSDLVYPVTNECRILNNYTKMTVYAGADPEEAGRE
ncbi:MAG: PASTA domain-containing protein [Solirubrobacterales bacterium]